MTIKLEFHEVFSFLNKMFKRSSCIFFLLKEILFFVQHSCEEGKELTRNKVEICGVDTSKLPVLKNEEM